MLNLTTECPYCGKDMVITFIDVGTVEEPRMMMGLVCDCGDWLEREMECSVEMAMQFGEIEETA